MATLTESQDVYDRHKLRVGFMHADIADVILGLEAQLAWIESELGTAHAEIARWRMRSGTRRGCTRLRAHGRLWRLR